MLKMIHFLRLIFLALSAGVICVSPAQADDYHPQPFTARYSVHVNGFKVGEIERNLKISPAGQYVLENVMYTTGLVALFKKDRALERSTWRLDKGRVVPVEYFAHYTGRSKDVVERLDFDWGNNTVSSLRDGATKAVELVEGTLDKLGHQIILRRDIATGKKHIEYQVADRGEIKPYIYDVIGKEDVVTARGTVNAIKVQKGTTTFWLAPQWDYLLVKLVQENDDSTFASYLQAE